MAHFSSISVCAFLHLIFQTAPGNWHPQSKTGKNSFVAAARSPVVSMGRCPEPVPGALKPWKG